MKKSIIALMGLFTLIACSEDSFDEIDQENEQLASEQNTNNGGMQVNSFDDSISTPYPFMPDYLSPWDLWHRNKKACPGYIFINGHNGSAYKLSVTAYIGLAYYDGKNDGKFYDLADTSISPSGKLIANMTVNTFPNLYANGDEIGGLIATQPMIFNGSTIPQSEANIRSNTLHCPVASSSGPEYNPLGRYFQLIGATNAERNLLKDYGKVFFYYVEVHDSSNALVGSGHIQVSNIPANTGTQSWKDTKVDAYPPASTSLTNLYYQNAGTLTGTQYVLGGTNNISDSREIDFQNAYPDMLTFGPVSVSVSFLYGYSYWEISSHVVELTY